MNENGIKDLIEKYYQYLNEMDYLRAAETIGMLKALGEKTDAYEVDLLFREQKYDQIIHSYMPVVKEYENAFLDANDKSELDDSIIPDHKIYEYIAASYSMLGSHDRSWQMLAFSREYEISYDHYCYEYCAWAAYLSGDYSDWEGKWNGGEIYDSFDWKNRFYYLIARQLAKFYRDNEAATDIKENSNEPDEFIELQTALINRISKLSRLDPALDYVESCIKEGRRFSKEVIVDLLLGCVQNSFKVSVRPKSLPELHDRLKMLSGSDIIEYLSIECILSPLTAYRDMTDYMKERISFLLSVGNRDLANTVFEIYYLVLFADEEEKTKLLRVTESLKYWEEILFEYFNDNLYAKKIREYENSTISKCLTPHGAVMYKAAQWQLMKMTEDANAYIDAGMLCLSYMRIVEYELNQKVIRRMVPYMDQLIAKSEEITKEIERKKKCKEINGELAGKIKSSITSCFGPKALEKMVKNIKEGKGVEMGPLYYFFSGFISEYPEVLSIAEIAEEILITNEILTEAGIRALKQKEYDENEPYRFVDMTDEKRREKYRNPPAHTRFVSLKTAMDCVKYVNKAIIKIDEYTV